MALKPTPEFFAQIATEPGVYIMRDERGKVIYVGKAVNLRSRVRQYFRPSGDERYFVAAGLLGRYLASVETVLVDNEKEALLLENHLIKKHQPRFNIKLRDDKQYLVLRVDPDKDYPRVEVVRNIKDDGARYFGPYHSASSCRDTLRTVNRYFQLRTCTDHVLKTRKRPCLQYQIKRCPGPCVFDIDEAAYAEQVDDVMLFLSGKDDQLIPRLESRMHAAADREDFEYAGKIRDSIRAVERTLARQNVVQEDMVDQDVFGLWRDADVVELTVLFIRGGKLVGRRSFRQKEQEFADSQVLSNFVQQYYATGTLVPDEVVVPTDIDDRELLADWLSSLRGGRKKKVRILTPRRGRRTKLVALAQKNAEASASARASVERDTEELLGKLQKRLALKHLPRRIECFDIAHIQGTMTVASMVTFIDGVPDKSLYRKFKVKTVTNDDFASMYEVLSRRFRRAAALGTPPHKRDDDLPRRDPWAVPDLLVIDGGKGQLGKAVAALEDIGINLRGERGFDVVALAKEREDAAGNELPDRVFRVGLKEPILLRPNTTEMFVLSRVRDEAHRFANTFHRQQRKKRTLRSALDDIPGIGAVRRKALLKHFGSVKAIRAATVDELAAAPSMGRAAAEAVHAFLRTGTPSTDSDVT